MKSTRLYLEFQLDLCYFGPTAFLNPGCVSYCYLNITQSRIAVNNGSILQIMTRLAQDRKGGEQTFPDFPSGSKKQTVYMMLWNGKNLLFPHKSPLPLNRNWNAVNSNAQICLRTSTCANLLKNPILDAE